MAGRPDGAMAALGVAVRNHDPYLLSLRIDFRLDSLRGRPDFQRVAREVGGG